MDTRAQGVWLNVPPPNFSGPFSRSPGRRSLMRTGRPSGPGGVLEAPLAAGARMRNGRNAFGAPQLRLARLGGAIRCESGHSRCREPERLLLKFDRRHFYSKADGYDNGMTSHMYCAAQLERYDYCDKRENILPDSLRFACKAKFERTLLSGGRWGGRAAIGRFRLWRP